MKIKKAFTLTEMIAALAVFAVLALITARVQNVLLRETPMVSRVIDEKIILSDVVHRIRTDIEKANGFPNELLDYEEGDDPLVIKTDEGIVVYVYKDSHLRRLVFDPTNLNNLLDKTVYSSQSLGVNWKLVTENEKVVAVQLLYGVDKKENGKISRRFKNSELICVGISQLNIKK